jgi:hypothetical protein
MKIGNTSLSTASVAVLILQLLLVTSIAAKYLYERWRCPRVWTRATAFAPDMPLRGRYLSLQVMVDGCQDRSFPLPAALPPHGQEGAESHLYGPPAAYAVPSRARLTVKDGKLLATRVDNASNMASAQIVAAWPGTSCDQMRLQKPVDFFIAEHAQSPAPVKAGQELWIEVTVPPKGPPRPIQLALKQDGAWKPLAFQ